MQEIAHDNRIAYLTWNLTPALAYYKAVKLRALLRQQVLAALDQVDVLVMPTMGSAAPKIEPDPIIDSKERSTRNRAGLTTAFSLASAPALSLCCGFTAEHLPIGLQIVGDAWDEAAVLGVLAHLERTEVAVARRPSLGVDLLGGVS